MVVPGQWWWYRASGGCTGPVQWESSQTVGIQPKQWEFSQNTGKQREFSQTVGIQPNSGDSAKQWGISAVVPYPDPYHGDPPWHAPPRYPLPPGTTTTRTTLLHVDPVPVHEPVDTNALTEMSKIQKLTSSGCSRKPLSGVCRALVVHAGLTVCLSGRHLPLARPTFSAKTVFFSQNQ